MHTYIHTYLRAYLTGIHISALILKTKTMSG